MTSKSSAGTVGWVTTSSSAARDAFAPIMTAASRSVYLKNMIGRGGASSQNKVKWEGHEADIIVWRG